MGGDKGAKDKGDKHIKQVLMPSASVSLASSESSLCLPKKGKALLLVLPV